MAIKHDAILGRANLYKVDPKAIIVQKGWNPRSDFSEEAENELLAYIKENGVDSLPPWKVKKTGDQIFLIDGERRQRATLKAIAQGIEISWVPCVFSANTISDPEALLLAISSNEGKPLNPVEEAEAFRKLKGWGLSVGDIARRVGKSTTHVYRRLVLVDASPELKEEIKTKNINIGEAEKIIKDSQGSVGRQSEKSDAVRRSNRMTIKEIRQKLAGIENGDTSLVDQDPRFIEGYKTALNHILDKRTMDPNHEEGK